MKKVSTPNINSIEVYEKKLSCEKGDRRRYLQENRDVVVAKYHNFPKKISEFITLDALCVEKELGEALIHSFESPTKSVNKMIVDIKKHHNDNVNSYCQYCGIDQAKTVDHYLPKSEFQEYSILHENLIPCCSVCNSRKGDRLKPSDVLNVYIDDIDQFELLKCDLVIQNKTIVASYYLEKPDSISNDDFDRIKNHYLNLNLFEEFKRSFAVIFSEETESIKSTNLNCREKLKVILEYKYHGTKNTFGQNHWKTVAYKKILNTNNILDYLLFGEDDL